jgi:hypothetical protein
MLPNQRGANAGGADGNRQARLLYGIGKITLAQIRSIAEVLEVRGDG